MSAEERVQDDQSITGSTFGKIFYIKNLQRKFSKIQENIFSKKGSGSIAIHLKLKLSMLFAFILIRRKTKHNREYDAMLPFRTYTALSVSIYQTNNKTV